jgi:hypothetical protein
LVLELEAITSISPFAALEMWDDVLVWIKLPQDDASFSSQSVTHYPEYHPGEDTKENRKLGSVIIIYVGEPSTSEKLLEFWRSGPSTSPLEFSCRICL